MFYYGYHFWGMHLIWWFVWIVFIFWIFATPYYRSSRGMMEDSPLDILQKRFANGELTKEDYQERKQILENDLKKK